MADSGKKPVDWEGVEREYRAGIRSAREIGVEFGCSHTAINNRAREHGWSRDLSAKIRAAAEAKLSKDELSIAEVSGGVSTESKISEQEIIETNALALVTVIRGHHKSLGRLSGVIQLLFDRLESELNGSDLFDRLGELMAAPDENGNDKLNELYRKVISLPSQTDTAKKLADTLKTHIELERKVFKIDDAQPTDPVESAARGAAQGATARMSEVAAGAMEKILARMDKNAVPGA